MDYRSRREDGNEGAIRSVRGGNLRLPTRVCVWWRNAPGLLRVDVGLVHPLPLYILFHILFFRSLTCITAYVAVALCARAYEREFACVYVCVRACAGSRQQLAAMSGMSVQVLGSRPPPGGTTYIGHLPFRFVPCTRYRMRAKLTIVSFVFEEFVLSLLARTMADLLVRSSVSPSYVCGVCYLKAVRGVVMCYLWEV